jgi:hypothetical protein
MTPLDGGIDYGSEQAPVSLPNLPLRCAKPLSIDYLAKHSIN